MSKKSARGRLAEIAGAFSKVLEHASSLKILRRYDLSEEAIVPGSGGCLRSCKACPRGSQKEPAEVFSAWILDKESLINQYGKQVAQRYLNLVRADVSALTRLRHPGILKVTQPLEENNKTLAFLTEAVAGTLRSLLSRERADGNSGERGLSELECKLGVLQVIETLSFLHERGGLMHLNVSPESILVARDGRWKLAGLGFAQAKSTKEPAFDLSEGEDDLLLSPSLQYCSPEMVATPAKLTETSDAYSLGLVVYEAFLGKHFLGRPRSKEEFLHNVNSAKLTDIPKDLWEALRYMLAPKASNRIDTDNLRNIRWFLEDERLQLVLRAQKLVECDDMEKVSVIRPFLMAKG